MRIVSLIASATEIVHALDLGEFQVGRSHECDYPESVRSLPVCTKPKFAIDGSSAEIDRLVKETLHSVGSVYDVFEDVLDRLAPTHLLTQTQCQVCAVSMADVERALGGRYSARAVALEPNSLADIWNDILRVAEACHVAERGASLVARLQSRMREVAERVANEPKPSVACIEWIEPLMAAGNWTPELMEMANGHNLFGEARKHSPWMQWEQLKTADPEVLLIAPCGFDLTRTRAELYWLTDRPDWGELRAVRNGRVYIADGNQYFNRPGPRVVETLEILASILHPKAYAVDLMDSFSSI